MDGSLFVADEENAAALRPGSAYARVAVERGIEGEGAEGLTYRCDGFVPRVGERVEVPLGKGGKRSSGIVVSVGGAEMLGGMAASKVKSVAARSGAALPEQLVDLARWMAGYYVCPLGMVLATMMPAAVKRGTGRRKVERVARAVIAPEAEAAAVAGLRPGTRRAWEAVRAVPEDEFPMGPKELALRVGAKSVAPVRSLIAAGLLTIDVGSELRAGTLPGVAALAGGVDGVTPTPEQAEAIGGIGARLGEFGVHLLRGVTGSGKTEVYLRLIAGVLAEGRRAIVLVPEIALTPQTAGRFTRRFGVGRVAVMHSGLTAAQRHREWARAASGDVGVVVGARSAVFAPLAGLGLIVVDEEHDGSYKQDRLPRYGARDVAIKRGQLAGCPVVLGSATPSLESWSNAASGRATLWTLPTRAGGARMPTVEVVDLAAERRARHAAAGGDDGRIHLLGPTLERALEETLGSGGQAILLLNRRGFAQHVLCPRGACGFALRCDQCDAGLVLHRRGGVGPAGFVRCHHCLAEQRMPTLCPSCGGKINTFGGGTQRAEDELVRKFASMGLAEGATLLRLDSDTMRSGRDFFEALSRFASGEARVLLGTQMVAKGLDFPNVRLVGVLDADTALNLPDFRAEERTFQLVSQVAGRAGRGERPGRVIVQTHTPDAPSIRLAAEHDYVGFATAEMRSRRRAGLPPVTRMARVVCRDAVIDRARAAADDVAAVLRREAGDEATVHGPFECAVSRIAGQHRIGVDVVAERAGTVQRILAAARAAGVVKSDAKTAVDVDPVALL